MDDAPLGEDRRLPLFCTIMVNIFSFILYSLTMRRQPQGRGGKELARRGENNISLVAANATVPTFVEDNKAPSQKPKIDLSLYGSCTKILVQNGLK
jgi:hypothetical protein